VVCLFVDELVGQRQTVVKGLSSYLGDVRGLSGCTVMGDGKISLILDVAGILGSLAA
jgi:two-component system chemotaxis sensor kinase CheA